MGQLDTIPRNNFTVQYGTSDFSFLNKDFAIVATVYLILIDFFIISGNSWVIFKIFFNFRKSMYLLASLVVSDLLTGITLIPLYLLWIYNVDFFVSHPICYGTMMMSLFLSGASILNIVAMTLERYIAICFPIFHQSFVKVNIKVVISVTISVVWFTSFLGALFSFFFMKRDFVICSYYNVYESKFLLWAIILGFFSPLCLLAAMYIKMIISVRKCFKRETDKTRSRLRSRLTSQSSEHRQNNINKCLRKMLTTLCLVLTGFIVCWGPFVFTIFLRLVCSSCQMPLLAYEVILFLGMTNSLVNPFIYCIRHRSFRNLRRRHTTVVYCKKDKSISYNSYHT